MAITFTHRYPSHCHSLLPVQDMNSRRREDQVLHYQSHCQLTSSRKVRLEGGMPTHMSGSRRAGAANAQSSPLSPAPGVSFIPVSLHRQGFQQNGSNFRDERSAARQIGTGTRRTFTLWREPPSPASERVLTGLDARAPRARARPVPPARRSFVLCSGVARDRLGLLRLRGEKRTWRGMAWRGDK